MTAKDTETIISEPNARERALNFLLGVGLIKTLVDSNRRVSFRAVTKGELVAYVQIFFLNEVIGLNLTYHSIRHGYRTKDLNGEENLVFSHIKAAGSEGKVRLVNTVMIPMMSFVIVVAHSLSLRDMDEAPQDKDEPSSNDYRSIPQDTDAKTTRETCPFRSGTQQPTSYCISSFSIDSTHSN